MASSQVGNCHHFGDQTRQAKRVNVERKWKSYEYICHPDRLGASVSSALREPLVDDAGVPMEQTREEAHRGARQRSHGIARFHASSDKMNATAGTGGSCKTRACKDTSEGVVPLPGDFDTRHSPRGHVSLKLRCGTNLVTSSGASDVAAVTNQIADSGALEEPGVEGAAAHTSVSATTMVKSAPATLPFPPAAAAIDQPGGPSGNSTEKGGAASSLYIQGEHSRGAALPGKRISKNSVGSHGYELKAVSKLKPFPGTPPCPTQGGPGTAAEQGQVAVTHQVLMQQLLGARTVYQTLQSVEEWRDYMNPVHTCTAFHRVAKYSRGANATRQAELRKDPAVVWLAKEVHRHLPTYGSQALTNIAWAQAQLMHGPEGLLHQVAEAAVPLASTFRYLEVSIMVHSLAKARCCHVALLEELVNLRVLNSLASYSSEQIMKLTWAHAKLEVFAPELFRQVALHMLLHLPQFPPSCLAGIAWSFAKGGYPAPDLFEAIAQSALRRLSSFSPQDVSNLAWAFARQGVVNTPLLRALARHCKPRLPQFCPQGLSNITWAFATLGHRDSSLMDAISDDAKRRLPQLSPQAVANIAWGFATLGHSDPALFGAIATHFPGRLGEFQLQSLSSLAFAFATLGHSAPRLFEDLASEVLRRLEGGELIRHCMVNFAWALVVQGFYPPQLLPVLRGHLARMQDYTSQELCQLYQVELALQLEAPDIGEALQLATGEAFPKDYFHKLWLSGHVKQQAKACWEYMNNADKRQVSFFQEQVLVALQRAGVPLVPEYKDGDYSVDIALLPGGSQSRTGQVAVEADGPSHFAYNGERCPLGPTLLKARLLRNRGWHVLQIPFYEWDALADEEAQYAYLKRHLAPYLDLPEWGNQPLQNSKGKIGKGLEAVGEGGGHAGELRDCSDRMEDTQAVVAGKNKSADDSERGAIGEIITRKEILDMALPSRKGRGQRLQLLRETAAKRVALKRLSRDN